MTRGMVSGFPVIDSNAQQGIGKLGGEERLRVTLVKCFPPWVAAAIGNQH